MHASITIWGSILTSQARLISRHYLEINHDKWSLIHAIITLWILRGAAERLDWIYSLNHRTTQALRIRFCVLVFCVPRCRQKKNSIAVMQYLCFTALYYMYFRLHSLQYAHIHTHSCVNYLKRYACLAIKNSLCSTHLLNLNIIHIKHGAILLLDWDEYTY